MSVRISTSQIYDSTLTSLNSQQAALLKVTQQLSAGRTLIDPSDDPINASREVSLTSNLATTNQLLDNQAAASSELSATESYLKSANDAVSAALTRVVQGGASSLNDDDRKSILSDLQGLRAQLLGIANTQDTNGNYIFAGYARGAQPFVQSGAGVVYQGDNGVRQAQIGPNTNIDVSFSGSYLFGDVPTGNNGLDVSAGASNTGSLVLNSGAIKDHAQWDANSADGPYTVTFEPVTTGTPPDTTDDVSYTIQDAAGNYVVGQDPATLVPPATNPLLSGSQEIEFDGVKIAFSGTPEAGDTLQFGNAGSQSLFDTIDQAIAALSASNDTPQASTVRANALYQVNVNLHGDMDRLLEAISSIGARQNQLDAATDTGQAQADQTTSTISKVVGADPASQAALATEFAQRTYNVQTAQQTYAQISKLSIFNYL